MTDDDIIDVVNWNQLNDYLKADKKDYNLGVADEIDYIPLKDGKYIIAKCRGARFDRIGKQYNDEREKLPGDFEELNNKTSQRTQNRYPRKTDYVWNNKKAHDLWNNPWFRNGDGNWTTERKKEVMNKIKNESKINEDRVVTNPKFRRLMKQAGLEDVMLVKGDGYFYLTSENDELFNTLDNLENFYFYSFNQQSPEDWVQDILDLLSESRINNIVKESIRSVLTENFMNNCIDKCVRKCLNEYLDKDYGLPLYHTSQKVLDGTKLVKPCWLIHGTDTNTARNIIRDGFSNGVSKDGLNRANLTYSNNAPHSDKGYSYAYKAEDWFNSNGTYLCYVLFYASGIEYFNRMDREWQILFYNKNTKNRVLIYKWNGEANLKGDEKFETFREKQLYGVGNINNKPLFVGKLGDVIKWTITNFTQYQKHLTTNNKIPTVSDETIKQYEKYLDKNGYADLPDDALNLHNKWHNYENEKEDMEIFLKNNDQSKNLYIRKRPDGEYWKY